MSHESTVKIKSTRLILWIIKNSYASIPSPVVSRSKKTRLWSLIDDDLCHCGTANGRGISYHNFNRTVGIINSYSRHISRTFSYFFT